MASKRRHPNDPREWLNRGRSNLALATHMLAGVYLEDLCFEAQQAAEKSLKAVFVGLGIPFPYSHDIGILLQLLEGHGVAIPNYLRDAVELTRFAVAARYPGVAKPLTQRVHKRAVKLAEKVLRWSERQVEAI